MHERESKAHEVEISVEVGGIYLIVEAVVETRDGGEDGGTQFRDVIEQVLHGLWFMTMKVS